MTQLTLVKGDITKMQTDAIVNAANSSLLGGGGVDGAIHRAAGGELLHECRLLAGCKTGEAKITKGYNLPAKHIIHTVGPVWNGGSKKEEPLLHSCYYKCLELCVKHKLATVAFPNISTGIYHFPKQLAAETALRAVNDFCEVYPDALREISFVCFDDENYNIYQFLLAEMPHP